MTKHWLMGCLWLYVCAAGAAPDEGFERARIARERASVEQHFAQRERDCRARFAVTACVDEARRERREAVSVLRRQQIVLDEAQRKQRAAQRMEAIRAKVSDTEARQSELMVREPRMAVPKPDSRETAAPAGVTRAAPREPAKAAPLRRVPRSAPAVRDRAAQEALSRKSFEANLEAATAHREALERRNAERGAKRKAARPLPTPASAASP